MAKYTKFKLSWKPSDSDLIVSYKLYWSKEDTISYDSHCIELGNVCEVVLPDIFKYPPREGTTIRFGISAVDTEGSESDIAFLSDTYKATAPMAPTDLSLECLDGLQSDKSATEADPSIEEDLQLDEWDELAKIAGPLLNPRPPQGRIKYYDDVGYRKLNMDK